jgi:hypothetical protein
MSEHHEAGRALDALVAEKVMGLLCADDPPGSGRNCPVHSCPAYSTDIAAAWQVVEAMNARGWIVNAMNRQVGRWACHVGFAAPNYATVLECEDTAPHAICLAALAALTAESPEPSHVV